MDITPFDTDLYQKIGEEIRKLNPSTTAGQVMLSNGGNVEAVLTALKTVVENFLSGDPDDNGVLDRLKELVAAIEANKDSIDAIVTDTVSKAELEALTTSVNELTARAHTHANKSLLDTLDEDADGNLTRNGKQVGGKYGAYVTVGPEDPGFADAVAALNLSDGAFFTVVSNVES